MAQLVPRGARLLAAPDIINQPGSRAQLGPLIVQGIVAHPRPAIRAEQRDRQGEILAMLTQRPAATRHVAIGTTKYAKDTASHV